LSYYFWLKKFTRNQCVYQENDASNEIYLIKEGEFKVKLFSFYNKWNFSEKVFKKFNVEKKPKNIDEAATHPKYGELPKLAFIQNFEVFFS